MHRPKFQIRFITHNGELRPVPSFDDWENVITAVVDGILETANSFPRIESKIFGQWGQEGPTTLRVRIILLRPLNCASSFFYNNDKTD